MPDQSADSQTILVIRLGAMGDILHALPAVASLKLSFPRKRLVWLVGHKWLPLLAGNPHVDEIVSFDRTTVSAFWDLRRTLRLLRPETAVDMQGLLKSAFVGRMAGTTKFFGFDKTIAREPLASMLYTDRIYVTGPHRIERNLQLVQSAGASVCTEESWIPAGVAEGDLPSGPYVLASPFAGWKSKQWPAHLYDRLAEALRKEGLQLVVNVSHERARDMASLKHVFVHCSSLAGLIYATRHAAAIVGVDSGPLHLAAALKKPGVALFGPTDPGQTGPFRSPMAVLRQPDVTTTYKRGRLIHPSMAGLSFEQVLQALLHSLSSEKQGIQTAVRDS